MSSNSHDARLLFLFWCLKIARIFVKELTLLEDNRKKANPNRISIKVRCDRDRSFDGAMVRILSRHLFWSSWSLVARHHRHHRHLNGVSAGLTGSQISWSQDSKNWSHESSYRDCNIWRKYYQILNISYTYYLGTISSPERQDSLTLTPLY